MRMHTGHQMPIPSSRGSGCFLATYPFLIWEVTIVRKFVGFSTAIFLVSISAGAQTDSRASSGQQPQAKQGDTTTPMTVVGCLVKEADYRQAHGLGKGALRGAG